MSFVLSHANKLSFIVKKYFQTERDTEGLFKKQSYVLFRKQYSGID